MSFAPRLNFKDSDVSPSLARRDEADRISVREELIAARVGELGNKAFGAQFGEVVAERGERIVLGGAAERFDDGGIDFGSGEGIAVVTQKAVLVLETVGRRRSRRMILMIFHRLKRMSATGCESSSLHGFWVPVYSGAAIVKRHDHVETGVRVRSPATVHAARRS